MLSPASLRVCCLAVMAPALSKADRRADFFPDVLSRPFCVSKTANILNGEDKIAGYPTNFVSKPACSANRRPPIPKQCRTYVNYGPGFNAKTRYIPHKCCLRNGSVRTNAGVLNKTWQSTNATTALAGKIKSKYTMSKNTSPVKNMGLAKATTSLGLQNLKIKRINQLPHSNKENESVHFSDNGEGSPDLPDSTNSELEAALLITEIKATVSESVAETEVSSTANDNEVPTPVSNEEICDLLDRNVSTMITMEELPVPCVSNCSIPEHPSSNISVSQLEVKDSPLRVTVTETGSMQTSESVVLSDSLELCDLNSSLALTSCNVPVLNDTNGSTLPVESDNACVSSFNSVSLHFGSNGREIEIPNCSVSDLPSPEVNFVMPSLTKEIVNDPFNIFSGVRLLAVTSEPSVCEIDTNSVLSSISASQLYNVSVSASDCSDFVASSTITCKVPPLKDEEKLCCHLSIQELNSIGNLLSEKEEKIFSSLDQSQLLLRKHMNSHAKQQIRNFIDYYQRKLNIPCQRPAKNIVKPGKELVDVKAELLQSEDVKNLSTAALVSLVRKLESSGSPGKLLPQPKVSPISELQSSEKQNLTFDPEDVADIKHTSGVMLNTMRNLLKSVDPYLTESSDDEIESNVEEEDTADSSSDIHKRALWKYLTKRAALASRSTWLLARIHELEYQIRGYNDRLKDLCASEGEVCLAEAVASQSSTSFTAGSDDVSLQATAKQAALKNLIKPMNGYLDHTHVSEAVVQSTTNLSSSFQQEQEAEKTSVFDIDESCCRTRPLKVSSFRKRKLIHTTGLHFVNNKFARLSTVSCYCSSLNEMHPCVLCTGRYNSVQSVDPDSMLIRERISLLDPYFHPVLSLEKDIPLALHFENLLKQNAAQYQNIRPPSPVASHRRLHFGAKPTRFSDLRNHSRKLNRFTRSLISAKYRNKHIRNSQHLRKHRLVFGKWRRLHNKNTFHDRDRIRRLSFASSASSHDSPVPSPVSIFDDGMGYDHMKKKRDDNQFDIDDVIIPCNSKSGRLVEIQYKEIVIPSWRYRDVQDSEVIEMEEVEDISDSTFIRRHDRLEIEEKKMLRSTALGLSAMNRRGRRNRCDSRADSSGANTPDPVLLCNQDIMFQVPHSIAAGDPSSPALSPPTTPSSATVVSDDSQPSFGNGSLARFERRKFMIQKRPVEENTSSRSATNDYDEIPPYERRVFPLSDKDYEELLAETILYKEEVDISPSGPSCPASPESSSSSTSTVEEDITDPEWTVVKRDTGPEQALVLKFAKR